MVALILGVFFARTVASYFMLSAQICFYCFSVSGHICELLHSLFMLFFSAKMFDFGMFAPSLFQSCTHCFGILDLTAGSSLCWAVW